jgi:hypothetical protein
MGLTEIEDLIKQKELTPRYVHQCSVNERHLPSGFRYDANVVDN